MNCAIELFHFFYRKNNCLSISFFEVVVTGLEPMKMFWFYKNEYRLNLTFLFINFSFYRHDS